MICILKIGSADVFSSFPFTPGDQQAITGWIIATDLPEARRKAEGVGEHMLAEGLYRMEFDPRPGKYKLPTGHIMLVD